MPQPHLNLSTDDNASSSSSFGVEKEARAPSSSHRSAHSAGINGQRQIRRDNKTERSPTSPRNFSSFFKGTGTNVRQDRVERPSSNRRELSDHNVAASEMTKPVMSHMYSMGSNNSTPSVARGAAALDDTSSMTSAVSAIHESIRSDDEINRIKAGSPSNLNEHLAQKKGSRGTLPTTLQRSSSRRHNESEDRSHAARAERQVEDRVGEPNRHANNLSSAALNHQDRNIREGTQRRARNPSADRSAVDSEDEVAVPQHKSLQNGFFSHFRTHGAKAADGIGRAGKGFFGKLKEGRSGSSNEKDATLVPVQPALDVLTLPLKEQTRITRIRKTMEDAGDKTEFWMPALPYRCIDYLNHHGIDSEGLYRIPGSVTEMKKYQTIFASPPYFDIDFLQDGNEPHDLNVVASLLKSWVRNLPEKLLPDDVQQRIEQEAPDAQSTPQVMRDELSKLPPYNYYLLFAITCHISLMHEHRATNKMNYGAIRTCWASLFVSAYIFQFLICDWRHCWQGCWTEQEQMIVEHEVYHETRTASPTPVSLLTNRIDNAPDKVTSEQPSTGIQAAGHFADSKPPERQERPDRPSRPPRPDLGDTYGRSTPPTTQETAKTDESSSQPFSQDLHGNRHLSPHKPSTPPSPNAPSHQPIQQMSPIRM